MRAANIRASVQGNSGWKTDQRATSMVRPEDDKNVRNEGIWGENSKALFSDASRFLEQMSKVGESVRKPSEDIGMREREKMGTNQKHGEGGLADGSIIPSSPMKEKEFEGGKGVSE